MALGLRRRDRCYAEAGDLQRGLRPNTAGPENYTQRPSNVRRGGRIGGICLDQEAFEA